MRSPESGSFVPARARQALSVGLIFLAAGLAVSALLGDSATFDEAGHLPAGAIHWRTGDLRLSPDHPPLARLWAGLPSLLVRLRMPDEASPGWQAGDFILAGRDFLFERNAPEPLLTRARLMVVALLLALLGLVAWAARRLFGPDAGLLALACGALSPALLAHGHLVTTDVPAALAAFGTLLAFAALAARPGALRLAGAAAAFAALVLTKNSWPAILPALAAMAAVAVLGRSAPRAGRGARVAVVAAASALSVLAAWGGLWACYGFRYSPFRGPGAATARMHVPAQPGVAPPLDQEGAWKSVLVDAHGMPAAGPAATFVRWGRARRAFPEAWLYGIALIGKMSPRVAFFRGAVGSGWPSYFPVAFLVKTPLPALLLAALGLAAMLLGRAKVRDPVLAVGLATFGLAYALLAIASGMNIGHRHLLPLEPLLAVAAGAAAAWAGTRAGKAMIGALVLWLAAETLVAHPGELGYFNEAAGGSRGGWRILADSNVDWGQDLNRLARWARANGSPEIRFSYFGVADPVAAGLSAVDVGSLYPFGARADLAPGVYAASVNQLVGLFVPQARDEFWERPGARAWYADRRAAFLRGALPEGSPARDAFLAAQRGRLLNGLKRREPDACVGTSIRVYRLAAADLEALLGP
jgi:4-amino-4-deoxy-L-arabinose transferase-like glycosyltransferase